MSNDILDPESPNYSPQATPDLQKVFYVTHTLDILYVPIACAVISIDGGVKLAHQEYFERQNVAPVRKYGDPCSKGQSTQDPTLAPQGIHRYRSSYLE